jgi:hypothetical protein
LNLSYNLIQGFLPENFKSLEILLSKAHIKELRLSYCKLADDKLLDLLLLGLGKNVYLEKLDLKGNCLKNAGVKKVVDQLITHEESAHNLKSLILSGNGHGNKALAHVASVLQGRLATVSQIELGCNTHNPMRKFFHQKSISKLMKNNRAIVKAIDQIDFPTPSDRRLFISVTHMLAVLSPVLDNKSIQAFPADILAIIFGYHLGIDSSFSWAQWQILTSCFLENPHLKQGNLTKVYEELNRKEFFRPSFVSQISAPERAVDFTKLALAEEEETMFLQGSFFSDADEEKSVQHDSRREAPSGAGAFFPAVLPDDIHSFGSLFREATDFSKSGQYAETISLCEERLIPWCQKKATPGMPHDINSRSVYLVLGEAYFELGCFEQALKSFESAKKHDSAIIDNGGRSVGRCQDGIDKCIEAASARAVQSAKI